MTKYRTITGIVAVALLAVAATTTNVRSHSHSTGPASALAAMSPNQLAVDINKLPSEDFNDMSLVFPRGTDR